MVQASARCIEHRQAGDQNLGRTWDKNTLITASSFLTSADASMTFVHKFGLHQYSSLLGLAFAMFHALILMGDTYIFSLRRFPTKRQSLNSYFMQNAHAHICGA